MAHGRVGRSIIMFVQKASGYDKALLASLKADIDRVLGRHGMVRKSGILRNDTREYLYRERT